MEGGRVGGREEEYGGRRGGMSSETPAYLIGIHPGGGTGQPSRKAAVIYEQWNLVNGWHPLTLKKNLTLSL